MNQYASRPVRRTKAAKREARQVRACPGDEKPGGRGSNDSAHVSREVLKSCPDSHIFRRSARLKDRKQVSCGQPDQRSAHDQDDSGMSILNARRRNQEEAGNECRRNHALASARFVPSPADQAVGNPPSYRLADTEDEVGKGSVQTCLQNRQMPDRYKVVGKPGEQQVPVIIKTEKAQTNTDQVAAAKML